jgi:hypothetical protein
MIAGDVNPYQIFAQARAVWSAQRYPNIVDYTVRVTGSLNGRTQVRHYHEFWMPDTGKIVVQPPVSDEQLADPYKPSSGVNFMNVWNIGGPRQGTGVKDLFDVPSLAPNYSFGIAVYQPSAQMTSAQIVQQVRNEYHDPAPQKVASLEAKSGLKTIAIVTSAVRDYRITLVGEEPVDGHADYHLALQPIADPRKNRLRDAWIEEKTYLTDRLRVAGNFQDAAMASVPWIVNYRTISGVTYVADETAQQPLDGVHGRMYDAFSVSFQDIGSGRKPFWASHGVPPESLSEP